ncbi:hypothetical protein [Yinghuangia soli]|uniref:Uncharacterized protein n=1 Tax=Yinghuangia soli TaxID=2908204 RepID=A0AA41PVG8_9ACTN|nr:hypothetical protein [Yinghuangia soli]MCF2526100.1 hypothetical protein [Yinghuangia soli]
MPEPIQRPATDDQLRMAADRAAGQWIDETERGLNDRWAALRPESAALAAIAAEDRRRWWSDRLSSYAHGRIRLWRNGARPDRRAIAEEAYAQLLTVQPRPGEQDLARPAGDVQRLLTDTVTATPAGAPHAAVARAVDAALAALAAEAAVLEELRSGKTAEVALALRDLDPMLTRIRQIDESGAEPGSLKRMVLDPHLAAAAALRRSLPDVRRLADESDRALSAALDTPLLDRCRTAVTPYPAARAAVPPAADELHKILGRLDTAEATYDRRFANNPELLKHAMHQVEFYGPAAIQALCAISGERTVQEALANLADPGREGEFRSFWPAGTDQEDLESAFQQAARRPRTPMEHGKSGYVREDRVNSAMG